MRGGCQDETLRILAQRKLGALFASVESAIDGNDALIKASSFRPDLVLTDHFMPAMAGDEFVRRLRADGFQGIIIGTTGAKLFEGVHPLIVAGADYLLPKPVLPETLVELLNAIDSGDKMLTARVHGFGLGFN